MILSEAKGAPQAKNLDTTILSGLPVGEREFAKCKRNWGDEWCDWEFIRNIGNLRLFGVSYTLLIFLVTLFYVVGRYNEQVELAQGWARTIGNTESKPLQSLAEQIQKAQLINMHWDSVSLLAGSFILILASMVYTFGCPDEIKDFTRSQWCYQLKQSLVHYWAYSWKHPIWRYTCGVLYVMGALMVGFPALFKIVRGLSYVWKYLSW